jgi:nitronate monooxygenase
MFLVSGPELVVAACRAGILGTFPALNQRTSEGFAAWLEEIEGALAKTPAAAPFGVNLIVHKSNRRLEQDLSICVAHRVPVVITSLGAVPDLVREVHGYGGVVFHDIVSRRHAEKAAAAGVDGLILVCAGAGGHAGTLNPFALLAEVRQVFSGTILLAGCISSGRDIFAARAMGADLAYLGTRFIATRESRAAEPYKRMLCAASAGDIVFTPAVSGIPGNFLRQSLEAAGLDPAALRSASDLATELQGGEIKAWRDIWSAGQGVAAIHDIPSVAELVDRLVAEFEAARRELCGSI